MPTGVGPVGAPDGVAGFAVRYGSELTVVRGRSAVSCCNGCCFCSNSSDRRPFSPRSQFFGVSVPAVRGFGTALAGRTKQEGAVFCG
jgi:hypothetical protein